MSRKDGVNKAPLVDAKTDNIIHEYNKHIQAELEFLRRYPRDGVGRSKKRPYRPMRMQNETLLKILQRKGVHLIITNMLL